MSGCRYDILGDGPETDAFGFQLGDYLDEVFHRSVEAVALPDRKGVAVSNITDGLSQPRTIGFHTQCLVFEARSVRRCENGQLTEQSANSRSDLCTDAADGSPVNTKDAVSAAFRPLFSIPPLWAVAMADRTGTQRKENNQRMLVDTELKHLPPELRWREWMGRIEAVIFAASEPVMRDTLARVVGKSCNIDLIIDEIREELRSRPYELVSVAGGWQHRTKKAFGDAIRAATGQGDISRPLSQSEALVLMCIAYFQPITRSELSTFFGKEVSHDLIGVLRAQYFIASGPRSPQPGAPYTYETTKAFVSHFGLDTLRDLPDFQAYEDAGLLSKDKLLAGDIPAGLAVGGR